MKYSKQHIIKCVSFLNGWLCNRDTTKIRKNDSNEPTVCGPVSSCEAWRIDAFAWFKRNARRTQCTHIHTSRSFQYSVCALRIETHPVYNRTGATLPLQTLMHRLSSCSCTTPRWRRQGKTIAFVSIRLTFTPCPVIFLPRTEQWKLSSRNNSCLQQ